jgi:hypothetical protein
MAAIEKRTLYDEEEWTVSYLIGERATLAGLLRSDARNGIHGTKARSNNKHPWCTSHARVHWLKWGIPSAAIAKSRER